jgi:NADH-quinone oxidoreductase subunit L
MTVPLVILALLSFVGGWVGLPAWLGHNSFGEFLSPSLKLAHETEHASGSHSMELLLALISVAVALASIGLAYRCYVTRPSLSASLAARFPAIHTLLRRKYYVDEIYDAVFVDSVVSGSRDILWKRFDVGVIDGAVNGVARMMQNLAGVLKNLQNGLVRSYASWILAGAVALLFYIYTVVQG